MVAALAGVAMTVPGDDLEPGAYDQWALDSHEYSPDKFYVKSTDGRGNSELLNLKMSPFEMGLLGELVESPDFPDYRRKGDVIRDALAHRMRHVRQMAKDPKRMAGLKQKTDMLMQEAHVERLRGEMEQRVRYCDALIENMQLAVDSGDVAALAEAIEAGERGQDTLPFNLAAKVRKACGEKTGQLGYMKQMAAQDAGDVERHA